MKNFLIKFEATDRFGTYFDSFELVADSEAAAIEYWRFLFPADDRTFYCINDVVTLEG